MKWTDASTFVLGLVGVIPFVVTENSNDVEDEVPTVENNTPGREIFENASETMLESERMLLPSRHHADTHCIGPIIFRGEQLHPNESICAVVNGEMVYYGIRSYPYVEGYTMYREEVWSEFGTFDKWFRGVSMTNESSPPKTIMQGDGNLVVFDQSTACRAKHAHRGPSVRAEIGGPFPVLMTVYDNDGNVLWTFEQMIRSYDGQKYVGRSACRAAEEPKCVRVLHEGQRLGWNEYVCEYDEAGNVVARFGLSKNGLLGLWRQNDELVWRPRDRRGVHIRGDYLRLQRDGHLTLFYIRSAEPNPGRRIYTWASYCRGVDKSKIIVGDGDVLHLNEDGSMAWAVMGTEKPSPVCFPTCTD